MEKSKLLEFMRSFSKTEMKEFGKYLEGTSYRKTSKVFKLFVYLNKLHPDFPNKKIEKEYVAKKVLNETQNISKKMADTMTQLFGVVEDFMVKKVLEENKIERDFLLLEAMKKRKLDKFFFQKIEFIEKDWQKHPPSGINQFYNEYKILNFLIFHPNYDNFLNDKIGLKELTKKIDTFYISTKLFLTLIIVNNSTEFVNELEEIQSDPLYLTQQIIQLSEFKFFQDFPKIKLIRDLLICLIEKSYDHYFELKQYFLENLESFDEDEKRDLFNIFIKLSFTLYNNGNNNFLGELFELNKLSIKHKLFLTNNYITNINFIGIINIACAVQEVEWADNFIDQFSSYLNEEDQNDIISLSQIRVGMVKKQYEEVLVKLNTVNFIDAFVAIQAKAIQLQCYYELGEDYLDLFLNHINSYSIYLTRKKEIAKEQKKAFKNFITLTNKLNKFQQQNSKNKIKELHTEIEQTNSLAHKSWLKKKLKSIEVNLKR